ncbi:coxsackievirus and adenovirus receptor-like [Acanthochromis polyacanthus]|uniref:coxsackievirus and adenovirus receptor-like n=1 Tax=Acanthochromis polyacanthus TaxID=80966 RepID=UPI002233EA7B|nr:coxsackievirus and adenovirus receptor-like [Acanthochromis polyacanthus]XP_051800704.1 coxsackievirus and adenovirus receptor-like [Acanthochromis polyacanthus]XP_051800705.1 coxsackievirus and adenovirus receptor-like [Acanthochromis polyacanthus]XP_051800706.1 coxsackievirus and adenovirus receptor-like [Acanthochromis polyacanthus]
MAAGTRVLCFLIICSLVCSSRAQTNITAKKIPTDLGEDVILPCTVPNKYNINSIAVKWTRPEMEPEYVLLYRDERSDPEYQHPSYQNRVDLQDKEMKDGDVSLNLKKVTMEDRGRYECRVIDKRNYEVISSSFLEVHLSTQKMTGVKNIIADLGQDVILPCKASKKDNKTITTVEWIRSEMKPDHVLLYRDGSFDPVLQHPSYKNRVDLQDKEMKDGDFSLSLKNVTKNDTGRYVCWVYQRKKFEPISNIIDLVVLDPGNKNAFFGDGGDKDINTRDGGDKTGIIAGSVVGVILLLAVAAAGFLIYRRCMMKPQQLYRDVTSS